MSILATCPEPARLWQLLAGELSADEELDLVRHLDSCPDCPARLESLAAGNASLIENVKHVSRETPPPHSAYWPVLQRFTGDVGQTAAGVDTTPDDDEPSLDFLTPADQPGLLGRLKHYNIVKVVGRGGMGVVLQAFDTHLQRQVALKVMSPQLANDETARKRFCREARAAAAITHENVVAVHHVEREETSDLPFLVMHLVNGESLETRLGREGPLPVKEIVRIGAEIAAGLAAAHAQQLVHRDIKPDNILLESPGGRVKLTDFGLARAAEDVKITASGLIAGTPVYMSPEQARGEALDPRSDLFSFGSVFYTLCTGQAPFDGSNTFVVLQKITEEEPRPITEINPKIPGWLTAVIAKLHAKNPAERFQSTQEVADLFRHLLARLESAEAPALPDCPHKARKRRMRTWLWAGGAVTFLAVALAFSEWTGFSRFFSGPRPGGLPSTEEGPSPALRATLHGNAGPVWSIAFSPDGATVATAIDDGTVKLWDPTAGRVRSTIAGHKGPVWSVAFSRDGALLASASDDAEVKLWDPKNSEELQSLHHSSSVRAIAWGPEHRLVTGTRNGHVRIWNATTGKEMVTTKGHTHVVVSVAFAADGKTIASASGDKTVKLWDAATGQEQLTLQGHTGAVYTVAFSPDGTRAASGGWDKTVRLWEVATGAPLATLQGHTQDIWSVTFSPDGKTLASASEDHTIKLWDVASGKELATFKGHTGGIYAVAYARDGLTIGTGGRDGTVRLWKAR